MYGTWCKAHFIPEKLTVKMGNNGRQHSLVAFREARESLAMVFSFINILLESLAKDMDNFST